LSDEICTGIFDSGKEWLFPGMSVQKGGSWASRENDCYVWKRIPVSRFHSGFEDGFRIAAKEINK